MKVETDRDEFGARQAEMTARWYENVKRTHGDVEAYIATRHAAYSDRWLEAARFIPDGAQVLDVGGGNLYPRLIDFFKSRDFNYSFLDVDPSCVDASGNLARDNGLTNAVFKHGYNDYLPFPDESFDAIFSSHCLEHSIDLRKTFREVNRVLADKGNLLMAVPFGWETNPEHPYFFGPNEWLAILMDSGFDIRVAQIGKEYPEEGHDYFIAARKVSEPKDFRLDAAAYTKETYQFASCFDQCFQYHGNALHQSDHIIVTGAGACIEFEVPAGVTEILPIFTRHDWSGIAEITWGDQTVVEDLYSWFTYVQPARIRAVGPHWAPKMKIRPLGKNEMSMANELVLLGVHFR